MQPLSLVALPGYLGEITVTTTLGDSETTAATVLSLVIEVSLDKINVLLDTPSARRCKERQIEMELKRLDRALNKGRLRTAYGSLLPSVKEKVLWYYGRLLADHPPPDKMLTKHMEGSIFPAIALMKVLPENGFSYDESMSLIRASVLDDALPSRQMFHKAGRIPFFFCLFRAMCRKSTEAMFGESGWQFEWKTNNKNMIQWDCHACIYHDIFLKFGMPQLTEIFCESDDVMYGDIPGVRWARTKTLGQGDEICDFCFIREK